MADDDVMKGPLQFHQAAKFLRKASGSSNIETTLIKAVKVLALYRIPHYVCGGFAVQEHGYPRLTVDVDLIVPDVQLAREKLAMNGFREIPGPRRMLTDRATKVEVDLLPGGGKVDTGPLTLPVPRLVSDKPQILRLQSLISAKLSTYIGRGIERVQDYADVVKLIQANRPPREYEVHPKILGAYFGIWDELYG